MDEEAGAGGIPHFEYATISVEIPVGNLKDSQLILVPQVKNIGIQTNTDIGIFEAGSFSRWMRFRICGKWRDCYAAARLLWYRMTKPFTAHVHGSWLTFTRQQHADVGYQSLEDLYPVSISQLGDANVLLLTGAFWNVVKLRRELIIRQRQKVGRMGSGGLLVAGYPCLPPERVTQAGRVLASIQQDLAANQRGHPSGNLNSLEMLQLLFGTMSIASQGQGSLSSGHPPVISTGQLHMSFLSNDSSASSSLCQNGDPIHGQSPRTSIEWDLINFPVLGE